MSSAHIKIRRDGDLPIELNNTSMTDVIFIFLIFFISLSQLRTSSVDVNLPTVGGKGASSKVDDTRPHVIEVSRESGIFLDGDKLDGEAAIAARVAAFREAAGGEEPRIRIRSDEESRSGALVRVIAALAEAGVKRVEFAVKTAPAAQAQPIEKLAPKTFEPVRRGAP